VRGFQRFGDLAHDRQRFVNVNRPARDAIGQRLADDQFEDERMIVIAVLETINRRYVWVVERRQHLCRAIEACEPIRIERKRVRDDLQRDVATQFHIACAINLAHAPGAERREDLVWAEAGAGVEGQTSGL
jgi:hypothetical protein